LISEDILAYLGQHERKELLRFLTCGNVDDGKSTLIGRLLHDSKMIYEDHLEAITRDSKKVGTTGDDIDLALLVDGLQAEREQGITIDVAYRYFSTAKRKFIIADTPGHEQYTRNMATGASTCDLAIILVDARYGVQTQTRRHSFIASLLGIKHIVVAINKMDLKDFDEGVFESIKADYLKFAEGLKMKPTSLHFVPMSALKGDNVVNKRALAVVHRPVADGNPRDRGSRGRPQLHRPALPGAVRQPSEPELPRLRRHPRQRHRAQGRRDRGAAVGQEQPRQVHRHLRR
jgi:bifunctional enzyme CysN/CysC